MSAETLYWADVRSTIGAFTLVTGPAGLLRVALSAGPEVIRELTDDLARITRITAVTLEYSPGRLAEPARQFGEYLAGTRCEFDLPLDWSLTSGFGRHVLRTLHGTVGYGQVLSYQDLATRAGRPSAARVVGAVMGSNPLPIVVPCHRVVAADGLGGFGGGLELKRRLLALEGVLPPTLDFG
ncbi:MAG TPA: methylated-DNA--[protein]-cysteine S-methyltransferase [Mycobacteriales bacterium]|nr:methylated-DNA--[protein]-cysteine S-methyltransferase [Mycobacteriales bacterium]